MSSPCRPSIEHRYDKYNHDVSAKQKEPIDFGHFLAFASFEMSCILTSCGSTRKIPGILGWCVCVCVCVCV